jgi:hypothetical protein
VGRAEARILARLDPIFILVLVMSQFVGDIHPSLRLGFPHTTRGDLSWYKILTTSARYFYSTPINDYILTESRLSETDKANLSHGSRQAIG